MARTKKQTVCGGTWVIEWTGEESGDAYPKDHPVSQRTGFLCTSGYVKVGDFVGERCPAWKRPHLVPECVRRVVRTNCQRKLAGFGRMRSSRRRRGMSGCGCGG